LTPSFSPSLVRFFFKEFSITEKSFVGEPFSGRGTTIIECQKHQIPALGLEINPLLQKVGQYSLIWKLDNLDLMKEFLYQFKDLINQHKNISIDAIINQDKFTLPNIHDVYRWWQPEILKELLIARDLILEEQFKTVYIYLWLALNTASLNCANIHRNHPTITFDDHHNRTINVFDSIQTEIDNIYRDLLKINNQKLQQTGNIILANSCNDFKEQSIIAKKFTHIITSPPYPNRYSYVHQTRPQLYFMEVIKERSAATEIDLQTIGGTWGRATSNLKKDLIIPEIKILKILDYFEELKEKSILMCNYATKYFIDINQHIQQLKKWIAPGFRGAYVVGNSRLSGVEIYTELILARLFEIQGFTVEKIIIFRKRGGKKKLYESAVIVRY
jgi:hypothetical protein